MKSINIKTFSAVILSGFLMVSCSKKIDEAYKNPNSPVRVPVEEILPGIIGNFIGSSAAAGSAYGLANDGLYTGRYVQYWGTNSSGNQYDQMGGATGVSDILGSVWAMHYFGMGQNLNKMIEWGIEEEKWDYVGVGYAIRSWSWLTLTDHYGEVILREAFNTSLQTFKYEEQPEVYDSVITIAHRALDYLSRTGGNVSQQNLAKGDAYFFNGDVTKWKKFVYGVLARSYHRLTNKAGYSADSVIKYASLAMSVNAENATSKFANSGITGTSNFYGPLRANVGALRQTAFVANLLSGVNPTFSGFADPRAWYLIRENTNGTFKGVQPNRGTSGLSTADQPQNFWGGTFGTLTAANDNSARYIFKNGAEFPIMTASEMQFLIAEAALIKGQDGVALQAYEKGIALNFDMLSTTYNASVPTAQLITPQSKQDYLDKAVPDAAADLTLSMVMLQKYIALYGWGMSETWVDMRRYHYTDLDPETDLQVYTDFAPPANLDLFIQNNNNLVYRARPRYNSEYLYNIPELDRIGALATDYHTKQIWFATKQ